MRVLCSLSRWIAYDPRLVKRPSDLCSVTPPDGLIPAAAHYSSDAAMIKLSSAENKAHLINGIISSRKRGALLNRKNGNQ